MKRTLRADTIRHSHSGWSASSSGLYAWHSAHVSELKQCVIFVCAVVPFQTTRLCAERRRCTALSSATRRSWTCTWRWHSRRQRSRSTAWRRRNRTTENGSDGSSWRRSASPANTDCSRPTPGRRRKIADGRPCRSASSPSFGPSQAKETTAGAATHTTP